MNEKENNKYFTQTENIVYSDIIPMRIYRTYIFCVIFYNYIFGVKYEASGADGEFTVGQRTKNECDCQFEDNRLQ